MGREASSCKQGGRGCPWRLLQEHLADHDGVDLRNGAACMALMTWRRAMMSRAMTVTTSTLKRMVLVMMIVMMRTTGTEDAPRPRPPKEPQRAPGSPRESPGRLARATEGPRAPSDSPRSPQEASKRPRRCLRISLKGPAQAVPRGPQEAKHFDTAGSAVHSFEKCSFFPWHGACRLAAAFQPVADVPGGLSGNIRLRL